MKLKMDEDYTLISNFEIDPTKVELKYNQEQSGDRNYGCHLCRSPRSDWFKKKQILEGFPLNRKLSSSIIEAERRRINPVRSERKIQMNHSHTNLTSRTCSPPGGAS